MSTHFFWPTRLGATNMACRRYESCWKPSSSGRLSFSVLFLSAANFTDNGGLHSTLKALLLVNVVVQVALSLTVRIKTQNNREYFNANNLVA
jgi:hypothetical protein